jgi:WD40 repeat protein
LLSIEAETICLPSGLKFALQTPAVCPTKVCRQLPAKSQSLRDEVLSANFSPDGKQIVSASMEICIWQLSPAQPSWQLQQLWHNDYRLNFTTC